MNQRNQRVQETARIRATAANAVQAAQVSDQRSNHVHGYRSMGFYQCARELPLQQGAMIVGSGYGGGTNAS
jgi:hypothetical protein